jgi:hypothetical protein
MPSAPQPAAAVGTTHVVRGLLVPRGQDAGGGEGPRSNLRGRGVGIGPAAGKKLALDNWTIERVAALMA